MTAEKVTRQMISSLKDGQSLVVELPNYKKVESAKVTCYTFQRILECKFRCVTNGKVLTITRYAL